MITKPDLCLPDHLTKIIEADYPRLSAPELKRLGELVVVTKTGAETLHTIP